jgi:hypothetical protein
MKLEAKKKINKNFDYFNLRKKGTISLNDFLRLSKKIKNKNKISVTNLYLILSFMLLLNLLVLIDN